MSDKLSSALGQSSDRRSWPVPITEPQVDLHERDGALSRVGEQGRITTRGQLNDTPFCWNERSTHQSHFWPQLEMSASLVQRGHKYHLPTRLLQNAMMKHAGRKLSRDRNDERRATLATHEVDTIDDSTSKSVPAEKAVRKFELPHIDTYCGVKSQTHTRCLNVGEQVRRKSSTCVHNVDSLSLNISRS